MPMTELARHIRHLGHLSWQTTLHVFPRHLCHLSRCRRACHPRHLRHLRRQMTLQMFRHLRQFWCNVFDARAPFANGEGS